MDTLQDVTSYIPTILQSANAPSVTGSELSILIKHKFPDFLPIRFGCKNIRDFLRRHVPEVTECGRKGMDYVYALAGSTREKADIGTFAAAASSEKRHPLVQDSRLWKTFASPRSFYQLYGHRETGQLAVFPIASSPSDQSWVHLPSCSAEKHLEIGEAFIETIPNEENRRMLSQWFGQHEWWRPFYINLVQLGFGPRWNAFRREKIIEEFERVRSERNVPPTRVLAPPSAPREVPSLPSEVGLSSSKVEHKGDAELARLRRVAANLVQNMSVTELRALNVRLGDVFDLFDE